MSAVVPPTPLDRLWNAFRLLVRAEFPTLTFFGIYEYAIQAVHGSVPNCTVDAAPTDTTLPLPGLTALPMRSAVDGGTSQPTVGNRCLVMFVNGDPTRAAVVSADPNAQVVTLDASSALHLGPSAKAVDVGAGATSVTAGPVPVTLAKSAAVVSAIGVLNTGFVALNTGLIAIATGFTALSSEAAISPSGQSACSAASTACSTAASACTTVSLGLAFLPASTPTTVFKGT